MKSLKLRSVDGKEVISFSSKIHPKDIGQGQHGRVFRLFSAEEARFLERGVEEHHVPSVILKVYHPENPERRYPDGFTQFYANSVIFNWLKKQPAEKFIIRPLHTYFVSERVLVRKFINAPTFEEARIALVGIQKKEIPLSKALSNKQIHRFLESNKIDLGELDRADRELNDLIYEGGKKNYGVNIPIKADAIWRNFFLLGKAPNGKLLVSVIDQGKELIPNLPDLIRRDQLFPAR